MRETVLCAEGIDRGRVREVVNPLQNDTFRAYLESSEGTWEFPQNIPSIFPLKIPTPIEKNWLH